MQDPDVVKAIEELKARWEEDRQATPTPFVPSTRSDLALQHAVTLEGMFGFGLQRTAVIGQDKTFSNISMDALKPITLREMNCHQVHKGKYLVCRTLYRAVRNIALHLFVEDFHGDAVLVCVYTLPALFQASVPLMDAYLPVGTILAIREPWLKMAGNSSQGNMIRIDSPSDIVLLSPSAHRLDWKTPSPDHGLLSGRSALDWKAKGNALFKERFFIPAVIAWTHAFNLDPSLIVLPLNRAQAYLSLKWYGAVLADAAFVLKTTPSDAEMMFKAKYRMAVAEYGLGMFRAAFSRFQTLKGDAGAGAAGVDQWMKRCISRVKEQEKGSYDWLHMFRSSGGSLVDLDVADYVSPGIKLSTFSKRGGRRGISAARDIKAGELLMVSNPFAIMTLNELDRHEHLSAINFITQTHKTGTQVGLLYRTVARMLGCPKEAGRIGDLYAGSKYPAPPSDYSLTQIPDHVAINPLEWSIDIDVAQVEGVATYNAFSPSALEQVTEETLSTGANEDAGSPSALYTFPSLFNHACHSNASWRFFGNVMFIRALQNIANETEITIPYVHHDDYSLRENALRPLLEGVCDCALCQADRADGALACQQREKFLRDLTVLARQTELKLDRKTALGLLSKIRATYGDVNGSTPRLILAYAYATVTQIVGHQAHSRGDLKQILESTKYGFHALEENGFKEVDTRASLNVQKFRFILPLSKDYLGYPGYADISILNMIHIGGSFVSLEEIVCAERWFRAAWWAHDAYYGGGKALFDARFGTLAGPMYAVEMEYRWN